MSLFVDGVGNNVSDAGSSEAGLVMAVSVGTATGSSDALVVAPITSVRLVSMSADVVETCRGPSVAVTAESMVVLKAIPLVSVESSCVESSVGSSSMLDGDG